MTVTPHTVCLIAAIVLLAVSAFWSYWQPVARFSPFAAGVFFYALKDLFPAAMALIAVAVLLSVSIVPAFAEEYAWTEDISKQGLDGFYVCTGTATYNGNTGSITHNVGPDWAQPRKSEMRWQIAQCERITREDVVNLFHYHWGQDIDPASVQISGEFR